jgi:hypothetical protein
MNYCAVYIRSIIIDLSSDRSTLLQRREVVTKLESANRRSRRGRLWWACRYAALSILVEGFSHVCQFYVQHGRSVEGLLLTCYRPSVGSS